MNLYVGHSYGRAGGNRKRLLRPCAVSDLKRPEYDMQLRTGLYSNAHNKLISSSKEVSHLKYEVLTGVTNFSYPQVQGGYSHPLRANTWIRSNDDDGAAGSLQFLYKSTQRHISQNYKSKKRRSFPCLRHEGVYWE